MFHVNKNTVLYHFCITSKQLSQTQSHPQHQTCQLRPLDHSHLNSNHLHQVILSQSSVFQSPPSLHCMPVSICNKHKTLYAQAKCYHSTWNSILTFLEHCFFELPVNKGIVVDVYFWVFSCYCDRRPDLTMQRVAEASEARNPSPDLFTDLVQVVRQSVLLSVTTSSLSASARPMAWPATYSGKE